MSTSSMQFQLMRAVSTTERERATGWGGMHYAKIEKISSSVIAFLALFMPHSIHETIASSASLELEKIFIAFLIKKKLANIKPEENSCSIGCFVSAGHK
jgi:hypothetical protein